MSKRLWGWLGHASTLWGLMPSTWQTAVTTGITAVTAYFGYATGGVFYALLGGGGMFCMAVIGSYYAILLRRQTSVFERLILENLAIIQAIPQGDKEKGISISGLTIECHFRNCSERTMYTQIKRASHSMGGVTVTGVTEISKNVSIVPPNTLHKIVLSTLPDIKVGGEKMVGNIDLEILYGASRDNLNYMLSYQSEPLMGMFLDLEKGQGQLSITSPIKKHLHERV